MEKPAFIRLILFIAESNCHQDPFDLKLLKQSVLFHDFLEASSYNRDINQAKEREKKAIKTN